MSYSYAAGTSTPTYAGLAEFNGLRINDGTFRSHHIPPITDSPPIRAAINLLPFDHGGLPGTPYYGPWEFDLTGRIFVSVADDLHAAIDDLKSKFNLNNTSIQTLKIASRGWTTARQMLARVNGQIVTSEPDTERKKLPERDFTIPLLAPDPLLYDADNLRTATIPMDGSSVTVVNAGTMPTPFVARFTGPWNTQTVLTCTTNSQVITYGSGAVGGAYIDVTTNLILGRTVVTNTGANNYKNMGAWTAFTIPVGTSHWTATATSGTTGASQVVLTWRDAWA